MIDIKNNFLLFFLFSFLFSNQFFFEWSSMTSAINPINITQDSNENIVGATSGGLLLLSNNQLDILSDNFNNLDLSVVGLDSKGLIWVAGSYPNANIQVFDSAYNLIYNSDYLVDQGVESITEFSFHSSKVFVVSSTAEDVRILEFNYNQNIPEYVEFYNNFPQQINSIYDIDLYNNNIYLTTDVGILKSDFIEEDLKRPGSWSQPVYYTNNENILFFHRNDFGSYLITESHLWLDSDGTTDILDLDSYPFDIQKQPNLDFFCTQNSCYEINQNSTNLVYSINDTYEINNYFKINNQLFFAVKNGGIASLDLENPLNQSHFVPNTLLQNKYDAITLLENGFLAGISETNGFIYDGNKFNYFIPSEYENLFPISILQEHMNDGNVQIQILDYIRGDKMIWSLVENKSGNIIFNNSGIRPDIQNAKGGVIEINPENFDLILYDTSRTNFMSSLETSYPFGTLDGLYGVSDDNVNDSYMVTHQIKKDNQGNVWVINPYSEQFNHVAAVQIYNNPEHWMHIFSDDESSYMPTEVAFDKYNRGWVGFQELETQNTEQFSNCGIKAFFHNDYIYQTNIQDYEENVVWLYPSNLEDFPCDESSSVWSVDIGAIGDQEILWVLISTKGAQGYILNNLELIPIYPLMYYSNIGFGKGDKIRVDSQNNAWITTRHSGIRIIKNNGTLWPDGDGFTETNSDLLSNEVYDIVFNNINGQAYMATKNGISILNIPFSNENVDLKKLYITPQPFIIPDQDYMYIKELISGSNIKIMTLNGYVLREFDLDYNQNILYWDGTDDKGNLLSTGIYYITSYKDGQSISEKIAIIRK